MTPKIVTRLANIAAKLAGSDKYDPTVKTKTAFEYYLDKGVDKILAIKGVPAAEVSDKGKVLSVSDSGVTVWADKGVPAAESDDIGKVLSVSDSGAPMWENKGLPAVDAGDVGKVLTVSGLGVPGWENGGPQVVTITRESAGVGACSMSYDAMKTALQNGGNLKFELSYFSNILVSTNYGYVSGLASIYVLFTLGYTAGPTYYLNQVLVTVTQYSVTLKQVDAEATFTDL